jgi:hypothetical protein
VSWTINYHYLFADELEGFSEAVRVELLAMIEHLREFGPMARRPHVDTLKNSKHANMKELRFAAGGGVWRVAFAFDPQRQALLLVAGNKSGVSQTKFYKALIETADERLDEHLEALEEAKRKK